MRAQAREKLLKAAVESLLRDETWSALGEALLGDRGGFRELAYRIDELSNHTAPDFLRTWSRVLKALDRRTYCFLAEDAADPAAYLATLL